MFRRVLQTPNLIKLASVGSLAYYCTNYAFAEDKKPALDGTYKEFILEESESISSDTKRLRFKLEDGQKFGNICFIWF